MTFRYFPDVHDVGHLIRVQNVSTWQQHVKNRLAMDTQILSCSICFRPETCPPLACPLTSAAPSTSALLRCVLAAAHKIFSPENTRGKKRLYLPHKLTSKLEELEEGPVSSWQSFPQMTSNE